MKSILVFQNFMPKDSNRNIEIKECIQHNLDLPFDEFYIFNDSITANYIDPKIINIPITKRLTFSEFLTVVEKPENKDALIILTNTDIKLDPNIFSLHNFISPSDFICLTRYETDVELSSDAWCTQDVWAMSGQGVNISVRTQSEIPLGLPGCEIRFAEIMQSGGFSVYNPSLDIKNIHLHSDKNMHKDINRIYGAYLFTHPCHLDDIKNKNLNNQLTYLSLTHKRLMSIN